VNTDRAHYRALPHVRLFSRRRRWPILIAVPVTVLLALAASPAAPPRSADTAGDTVVLTAVTRPAAAQAASAYRIRPGDTLSGIAARLCGNPSYYTGLAADNGISNPDFILAGATLYRIRCYHAAIAAPRAYHHSYTTYHHHRYRVYYAPRSTHRHRHHYYSPGTYHGSSGCQARIIANESDGNSQVMNSSGHYGLYQFSRSTWEAHGGSSATFGHASVAEQNRVFYNTVAANGYRDWAASGGCG
jgi:hypothetical protein